MGQEQETRLDNPEATPEDIRRGLVNRFIEKYRPFQYGTETDKTFLIVRFTPAKDLTIRLLNGAEEVPTPYENLDALIRARFEQDREYNFSELKHSMHVDFTPFDDMPEGLNEFKGPLWEQMTAWKLISWPLAEKWMVHARMYHALAKETGPALFEYWRGETRTKKPPVGSIGGQHGVIRHVTSKSTK